MTGSVRIPFREPRSAARLSRTFSQSLSAMEIAEPLASLDENQSVTMAAELLCVQASTVLGVRRNGILAGWVTNTDLTGGLLSNASRDFDDEQVLDGCVGLGVVLSKFATTEFVFVEWLGEVAGVITRGDLQKPPMRMWLFGAITVLDANMTWAIEELYPANSWQVLVSPGRFEKAAALQEERRRIKSDCRLVDCLQIADKAAILSSDREHIAALGLPSRKEAERLMRGIEALRNHLAHAQELGSAHLATATKLATMIDSILRAEGVQRILALRADASKPISKPPIPAVSL